jgi:hypothetical protein
MFADRAYSRGLVASPDRLASLLYFAAAVPTVGFIHGTADLSPLNAAALEGCFPKRAPRIDTAAHIWATWSQAIGPQAIAEGPRNEG